MGRRGQWGRFVGVKITMSGRPLLDGGQEARGLAPGGDAQAFARLADAHVDAGWRDAQLLGDLLGGKAATHEDEAFALSRRQAGDPLGRR